MGLSVFLNKQILNFRFSDALAKYDTDGNGFTKQEFSNALNDATSVFARYIIKMTGYDKTLFNELNADKNDIISYEEMSDYIKNEYQLDFSKISALTLKDICTEFDKLQKNKKKH